MFHHHNYHHKEMTMNELEQLANLIKKWNLIEQDISTIIGRPAQIGHLGEFIASEVFDIDLEISASRKGIDGRFKEGILKGKTVNIKWYTIREGLLDITPGFLPDYYLVLAGPKSPAMSSRGKIRPWKIANVYLFDVPSLVDELQKRGVKIGIATSVREEQWNRAEIYPLSKRGTFQITNEQSKKLALFG